MGAAKMLMITAIVLASISIGYFRDKKKRYIAIGVLGVLCAFYLAVFYGK